MIPPKKSARFVWRMEEVLDLYERPYDPLFPVVCFDERPCQLLAEVREPLPGGRGRLKRRDHEYERRGMANVLMAFEPLTGWRQVEVTERRRGREFAEAVGRLAEEVYPSAQRIRLVSDNLSTHSAAAFYETFPPEQARRLAERVEFVHTPVGARLMAEHGRDRAVGPGAPVPQASATRRRNAAARSAGVGGGAKSGRCER